MPRSSATLQHTLSGCPPGFQWEGIRREMGEQMGPVERPFSLSSQGHNTRLECVLESELFPVDSEASTIHLTWL